MNRKNEEIEKQLKRAHVIIVCLIGCLIMCGLILIIIIQCTEIKVSKEIVKIHTDSGNAIYQNGKENRYIQEKE